MPTATARSTTRASGLRRCAAAAALLLVHAVTPAQPTPLADPQGPWQPPRQQRFLLSLTTAPAPMHWAQLPHGGANLMQPQPAQPASLNLDFRRVSAHRQAKDLLRVQLTADSVLNFRPRGGGLVVTYRAQF